MNAHTLNPLLLCFPLFFGKKKKKIVREKKETKEKEREKGKRGQKNGESRGVLEKEIYNTHTHFIFFFCFCFGLVFSNQGLIKYKGKVYCFVNYFTHFFSLPHSLTLHSFHPITSITPHSTQLWHTHSRIPSLVSLVCHTTEASIYRCPTLNF